MHILVAGGAGYVGSHAVEALLELGAKPTIVDDFSTGHQWALQGANVIEVDITDLPALRKALSGLRPDGVMHFAAKSIVSESMIDPTKYFFNNVTGSINLIRWCLENAVPNFVFSSTAAVYGNPVSDVIDESHTLSPINPYGQSKFFVEQILNRVHSANGLSSISFRYFNAAGASKSSQIGEDHEPETHLIPNVLKSILKSDSNSKLKIYGNDYPTNDGTCVRDYVHVSDLAEAHVSALSFLTSNAGSFKINLGTGRGYSVMEILEACQKVTGKTISFEVADRREGDPAVLVASNQLAKDLLDWQPKESILEIIRDAYRWHSLRSNFD